MELCLGDLTLNLQGGSDDFFFSERVNGLPHLCVHRQVN